MTTAIPKATNATMPAMSDEAALKEEPSLVDAVIEAAADEAEEAVADEAEEDAAVTAEPPEVEVA